jgi:hypothetical protein
MKARIPFLNLPPFTMSKSYSENGCSPLVLLQNLHEISDGVYRELKLVYSKTSSLKQMLFKIEFNEHVWINICSIDVPRFKD